MTAPRPLRGVPPDLLLGALSSLPGAFWLSSGGVAFAGALPTGRSEALDPEPDLQPSQERGAKSSPVFPRWVGALPYECARSGERTRAPDLRPQPILARPVWQRYEAVIRFDSAEPCIVAASDDAAERLEGAVRSRLRPLATAAASLAWLEPPERESLHEERIVRALEHIRRGDLYQVNLARRFAFEKSGHPLELLGRLAARTAGEAFDSTRLSALSPYALAIDFGDAQVVSTSPESFLELGPGGAIATRPIKGTRPRDPEPLRDRALARQLDESEKERAELAMVIDIERNDLGRLARAGSVRLAEAPTVVSLATVHHRHALVTAELLPGVTRADVLRVMMPSGSVTGAPKVRAMDLIRELEVHRRGLYTGALGAVLSDGSLELSMAIRCLVAQAGRAEYWSGGGIVADSDPKAEVQETLWKAEQLLTLLGTRELAGR